MDRRVCPFCGDAVDGASCGGCGRDPTASRRICPKCGKSTPIVEQACCHCGATARSELAWKVPVIVALFVGALILSILVGLIR